MIFATVFGCRGWVFRVCIAADADVLFVAEFVRRMLCSWLYLVGCGRDFRGWFWLDADGIFVSIFGWQRMCVFPAEIRWLRMRFPWRYLAGRECCFRGCKCLDADAIFVVVFGWLRTVYS